MKECRNCTHSTLFKASDSVECRLKNKVLLSNRAENCDDYHDGWKIKAVKKKQEENNSNK